MLAAELVGLLERIDAARREKRSGVDDYITDYMAPASFSYNGSSYSVPLSAYGVTQTMAGQQVQRIAATLPGYMSALRMCPPAFAAQMVRALVVSQARFVWRNKPWSSTPRRTFGTSGLSLLERPWAEGATGGLPATMGWPSGPAR